MQRVGTAKTKGTHVPKPRIRKKKSKRRYSKLKLKQLKIDTLKFVADTLAALLTDGFNQLPSYTLTDYRRDLQTIKARLDGEGLYFAVKVLPELSQGMFSLLEGRPASFSGFKLRDGYPVFMRGVLHNALTGHTESIRLIYQISVAFKKLEGKYSKDKVVELWEDFVSCDSSLLDIDWFSPDRLPILERARHFCKEMFRDYDVYGQDTIPRPGPGSTNTPTKPWMRYEPHKRYLNIDKLFPYEEWFYPHNFSSYGANLSQLEKQHLLQLEECPEPMSRYKGVPKTALKLRGICITENEVQYLQQAVRRSMTKTIERHPLYKRRIVLDDQTVNGWMALTSSLTRKFATLDLKSASDLDARELVSWIFQDNVDLHNALMVLSDRYVQPPKEVGGEPLRILKFAPMGSALCFPVMSLVLMFLIRASLQLSNAQYPHLDSTNVFVYGDDIVVPSHHFRLVCDTLETFGFQINENKSFVASHFRESCGVHAWKGTDITPVYIRKTPSSTLSTVVSFVDTEKQLIDKDYYHTAAVLRYHLTSKKPRFFRRNEFVPKGSPVVGWQRDYVDDSVVVPRYRCKWDADTQQYLYKAKVFSIEPDAVGLAIETQAYLRWRCLGPSQSEVNVKKNYWDSQAAEWRKEASCFLASASRVLPAGNARDDVIRTVQRWVPRSQLLVGTSGP